MKAMKIWIITTGSSDVQLDKKNKWTDLFRNVRSQVKPGFTPTDGTDNRLLAPARVMGTVYSQPQAKQYFGNLAFPLLDNFVGQIKNEVIDQIILILTDQTVVFGPEQRQPNSAYWQDTCTLQPILETYLKDKFPQAELKPLLLKPQSPTDGLDDWDYVLKLVQGEFSKSEFDFPNESTIYVSHQAGTPAISSAVQFSSLAQFGERVKFLVSSERDSNLTRILDGSTYLKGIRLQEAKALLDRHDYAGVKDLVDSYLTPEIQILLDAAIQWNFAKFDEFAKVMTKVASKYSKDDEWWQAIDKLVNFRSKEWWWTAYESAYLAVVRLEQGNVVDAMFHSFRAVEGLIRLWADEKYRQHIQYTRNGSPYILFPGNNRFNLFGKQLYDCLEHCRTIDSQNDEDIWRFGTVTFDKRNQYFHQLFGLLEEEVFQAWDTDNRTRWKARILGCLNFIAEPKPLFISLEEASLMFKVHQELVKAIAPNNLQT